MSRLNKANRAPSHPVDEFVSMSVWNSITLVMSPVSDFTSCSVCSTSVPSSALTIQVISAECSSVPSATQLNSGVWDPVMKVSGPVK